MADPELWISHNFSKCEPELEIYINEPWLGFDPLYLILGKVYASLSKVPGKVV
jgi:hypothetical protein